MVYADVPEHEGFNEGKAPEKAPRPNTTDGWLERISDQLQVFVDAINDARDDDADGEGGTSTVTVTEPATGKPDDEPKGNASTEEWVAYAKSKGASDEDLKDEQGDPLGQKALKAKYGTPAS